MLNAIYVKTGHMILLSRETSYKTQIIKISQGHNELGIKNNWYEFVKHLLYLVESASALNAFLYLLLKSCL